MSVREFIVIIIIIIVIIFIIVVIIFIIIVIIFIIIVIIFYRLSMLKPAKKKGLHTSNTGLGNTTTRMFYHYLFIYLFIVIILVYRCLYTVH